MIGFINVYKPENVTSNFVVQKIKKKFKLSKIGHMGTLDPMATGILPIAIGKATRLFDYSLNKTKEYVVIYDFGYTTDTLDITGEITKKSDNLPTVDDIKNKVLKLIGKQNQMPPRYSAKNVNGKRAYELARSGQEFELKPKEVEIFEFEMIEKLSEYQYKFRIVCSSGTYIRAIGRDLASLLDTYACMSFLERTSTGEFNKNSSFTLDEIINSKSLEDIIISPIDIFKNFNKININDDIYKKLKNGISINNFEITNTSFVLHDNNIIGIAEPNKFLKLSTYLEE